MRDARRRVIGLINMDGEGYVLLELSCGHIVRRDLIYSVNYKRARCACCSTGAASEPMPELDPEL